VIYFHQGLSAASDKKFPYFCSIPLRLSEGTKKTGIHFPVVMVSRGTGIDETTGPVPVLENE
jgi:hypothetical protein